jgi:hypothetical protein
MAVNSPAVGDPTVASYADAVAAQLNASVIRFRGMLPASTAVAANTNIGFAATEDPSAGWNAISKLWTVPAGAAGLYLFSVQCRCGATAATPIAQLIITGGVYSIGSQPAAGAAATSVLTITRALAVGDTVAAQSVGAYTATVSGNDNFLTVTRLGNS